MLDEQLKFLNIEKYHNLGFKGQGITILNAEQNNDHMHMTNQVIRDFAPEATIINGSITGSTVNGKVSTFLTIDGKALEFEEAIDKYKIKIITISKSGTTSIARLNYFKDIQKRKGVIFFNSAGNDGVDGITGIYTKDDTAIAVGAAYLADNNEIKLYFYSARGKELDFITFLANGRGTSASSPALAAQTALLLQRYGDFTQAECIEILKSISIKFSNKNSYGYGLPVLPLTDKLEVLNKVDFKDVEETRWSKPAIDKCVEQGLLLGFEDGTFRPTEHVTREQFATILTRILDKIEGR